MESRLEVERKKGRRIERKKIRKYRGWKVCGRVTRYQERVQILFQQS